MLALLAPAARWTAIQLTVRAVFPRIPRGQEQGLDRLLSGMLLAQSVPAFPAHAAHLRRLAVDHLLAAASSPGERGYRLAALADAFDRLAAVPPADRALYEHAHREYARALTVLQRAPAVPSLVERYRIRQAICWLDSGIPDACADAFAWLGQHPDVVGEGAAAETRYDAACLFALAARRSPDPGARSARRAHRRRTAAASPDVALRRPDA